MNVDIYKCFIASPGDTIEERDVCDRIFGEINSTLGQTLNFRIESKRWEKDARPSFGSDGQDVINKQLLNEYQIFIGIMWNRFGAPTPRAESGTEEEFQQAFEKCKSKGDVEIMMYFNSALADVNTLDLDQVQKVRDFKKKVAALGGLYHSYSGTVEFERKLRSHLHSFFSEKLGKKNITEKPNSIDEKNQEYPKFESVYQELSSRLSDSLKLFSNQPTIWVDPVLSKSNEISKSATENFASRVNVAEIIEEPESTIIKAPPQFGLTSLAHHLVLESWKKGSTWVYLDARTAKRDAIRKCVEKELRKLNISDKEPNCIVLDSWNNLEPGSKKLLRNLCHEYPETPVIVMQTIDDSSFKSEEKSENINREFKTLHLLALPRNQIRKVVCNYNDEKNIGDENVILEKVIKDLEVLNIHRTPLNCITLLKVSENNFDESPVNRTKMIEMVLFVLFNMADLPAYKTRPDLKDCEYVLGRFCEKLIRQKKYRFSRIDFLDEIDRFCKEKLLHLEVSVVFDTLYNNNILTRIESEFCFRASYWIYYFAARRMYSNVEFRKYILTEQSYISFPEIIEFYTGIDRNRGDLLQVLIEDLRSTCEIVDSKTGLPADLNPLSEVEWNPSEEAVSQLKSILNDDVLNSNLPEYLKDEYADQGYNQLRPYDQGIQNILKEYSLTILIQKIKASSRALRNSDYVDPDIKRALLKEITRGWRQISCILFALAPMLATRGEAAFEGQNFILAEGFGDTPEQRIGNIFLANPINVVKMFKHDLFSNKLGPLLFDGISSETDEIIRHQLILLLISERPTEWKKHVEQYMIKTPKNSFYLHDTVGVLANNYKYSFASEIELSEIKYLLKVGYAKHEFGNDKPSLVELNKISNKVIPKREAMQ
ncbi:hypothetical protein ACOCLD_18160 [Pseudomonas sp. MAC6]|uniref:STAND family AAA ATPase n=1 Tax=Pseudomonas sp. MAC6 TaxID=3401633 RepID=UPI003BF47C2C